MRSNFSEILRAAIAENRRDMHTAMPGRIESYEFSEQRASVKPLLNPTLADGRVLDLPVISNVRVIWPASGGASMTFPVKPGDGCLLVFSESSIDEWLDEGGSIAVNDPRRNSMQDAMAIMGMDSFAAGTKAENNTDVLLAYAGSKVRLKPSGISEIECVESDVTASKAARVTSPEITLTGETTIVGNLFVTGNITFGSDGSGNMIGNGDLETTGDVKAGGISLKTHTHGGVQSGNDSTGTPE